VAPELLGAEDCLRYRAGDPEGFADRLAGQSAGQSAGQFGWCIHTLEVHVCDATLTEPQQRLAATLPLLMDPEV